MIPTPRLCSASRQSSGAQFRQASLPAAGNRDQAGVIVRHLESFQDHRTVTVFLAARGVCLFAPIRRMHLPTLAARRQFRRRAKESPMFTKIAVALFAFVAVAAPSLAASDRGLLSRPGASQGHDPLPFTAAERALFDRATGSVDSN